MRARIVVVVLSTGLGASCTQFPELDAAVDPAVYNRDFPAILPLDTVLEAPEQRVSPAIATEVGGRVSTLRARAARLAGPVVDAATKARMARGVRQR